MTDEAETLLAAYDAQLRGASEVAGSLRWDRSGPLWRAVFATSGLVSYESLEGVEDVDALIAETVAFFAGIAEVEEFEWKTRGHDRPADLGARLQAQGLEPEELETVMVGAARSLAVDIALPAGVVVRRVDDLPRTLLRVRGSAEAPGGPGSQRGDGRTPAEASSLARASRKRR